MGRIEFSDPLGIIHQLAPDDAARPNLAIRSADRPEVIRLLRRAKQSESGWHKQLAIYYLALFGQEESQNVRELLRIWRSAPHEETMGLIIGLYKHGHKELLTVITEAGPHSDAALAEELGDFFGEELATDPRVFIAALSKLSSQDQQAVCVLSGEADGGGIGPEAEATILRNLAMLNSEVATRCADSVREGSRRAQRSNQ